jgi:hypothetical protein
VTAPRPTQGLVYSSGRSGPHKSLTTKQLLPRFQNLRWADEKINATRRRCLGEYRTRAAARGLGALTLGISDAYIKRSNCVVSPRLFHKLKSRRWLRKRLATGFGHSRGGPAKEIEPSGAGEKKF